MTINYVFDNIIKNSKFYIFLCRIIVERSKVMKNIQNTIFVGVETVVKDLGISKPKAYKIIKELNEKLKKANPNAIIINGKVNRNWYNQACLIRSNDETVKLNYSAERGGGQDVRESG